MGLILQILKVKTRDQMGPIVQVLSRARDKMGSIV